MNEGIARILAAAGELRALPGSWQRVDAVLAREAATTEQIAEAVAGDPALAARVLRLANSPLFGLARRVERLSQAVHLIGTRQLRDLALAMAVVDTVRAAGDRARAEAFLARSVAVGLAARALAQRRREANVERYLVIGLLHDIGWFAWWLGDAAQAERCWTRARERAEPLEASERQLAGFDHAEVGEALLQQWQLPSSLAEPVRCHHRPGLAAAQRVESALAHLAVVAAELAGLAPGSGVSTPLDAAAWELVALEPAQLVAALREAETALTETLAILATTA